MARIQQKSAGRKYKRERLDGHAMREAIKTSLEAKGLTLPRFGQLRREAASSKPAH